MHVDYADTIKLAFMSTKITLRQNVIMLELYLRLGFVHPGFEHVLGLNPLPSDVIDYAYSVAG